MSELDEKLCRIILKSRELERIQILKKHLSALVHTYTAFKLSSENEEKKKVFLDSTNILIELIDEEILILYKKIEEKIKCLEKK